MKKKWFNEKGYYSLFKWLRVMKLTMLFLFCTLTHVSASVYAQQTKLNISLKDVSVKEVLKQIENQTDFFFLYKNENVDVNRIVSVDIKDKSIESLLDQIFKGTTVSYEVINRQIVLIDKVKGGELFPSQQQKSISGKVTDPSGAPLPGVSVVVKGTTNGTITDVEGNYSLSKVPENSNLQFSFVGMKTQEIAVGAKTSINVILLDETIGLEEVVAVGYGVQKKVNLTGAISSVKFDESIENRPITNASQALGGKVTGVWVSQNSGKPGSDASQLRVRGWGTLNNSNPLIIIDGVEGAFDQLNPSDIESISVLKDAASAAIYGSKAANGVVLITTKMGKTNEKMKVNVSSYVGVQSLGRKYDMIDNSAEYMQLWNKALGNDGKNPLYPDYLINAFKSGNDPYKYPNTNWFNTLFKNALIQEHNLSIQGGTAQSSSFLSFNYLNQDGLVPNTSSERYGIRANLDLDVKKWMKVSGRLNFNRKISKEPYADITYGSLGRVFTMFAGATPFIAPYTSDGRFGSIEAIDSNGTLLFDNRNPLIETANGTTQTEDNYLSINASAEIKFSKDLLWKTTVSSNNIFEMVDKYNQSVFGYTDSGVQTTTKNFNREGIEMNRKSLSTRDDNLFSTLNYNKKIGNLHSISAIAGMQLESTITKDAYARKTNPPKEGLTQVDAGTSGIVANGNMYGLKMLSYFGRINYTFSDKYLLEGNFRADASSRFKKGNRWGLFPGFSAGWRMSEEKFIKNLNFFSNLKFRASWGELGNQNISGYWPYLTVVDQNNNLSYSYNKSFAPGAAVTSLIDDNVTWETTSTLDVGFDAGFFRNKLSIEADYFNKQTRDIIVQLPIPLIMGELTAPYENVGGMTNAGFELNMNYDSQENDRNKFGYNLGFNLTYINNEVTKFREGAPDQLYLIREGYSYKTLYGYKVIGIFQSDDEATKYMANNSYKPKAGNLKFEDVNNDGKLGFEDKQNLGNTIPKFTFGFSSGFKYKGFDLNFQLLGIAGANAYTQNDLTNLTTDNPTMTKKWRNAWSPENKGSNVPAIRFDNSWDNSESSFWVHNISFLKLKNIQLGYAVPEKIFSKLKFEKLYVYVNAQNVFTIVNKDYEGYDPERNTFDSGWNMYPIPRIFSFGINLNF